jgi:FdrA protein
MPLTLSEMLATKPVFINVGVREFGDSLRAAGFEVIQLDWSPPAGGDVDIAALLDDLL